MLTADGASITAEPEGGPADAASGGGGGGGGGRNRGGDRQRGVAARPATPPAPTKLGSTTAAGGPGGIGAGGAGPLTAAAAAAVVAGSPSSPKSSFSGPTLGESLLGLAGAGGGAGREESRAGAAPGASYVDNFLAAFARGGGGGGDDDRRPRRISSGGRLDADDDAASRWRMVDAAGAGESEDARSSSSSSSRGGGETAAAVPVGGDGLPYRCRLGESLHQAPLLQGSPLRPGGRAAVVPNHAPSYHGRSGATRTPADDANGKGSARGITDYHGGLAGVLDEQSGGVPIKRSAPAGAPAGRGTGGSSAAVSKARGNIDRMMSSLLEEVLPDRRGAASSEAAPGNRSGGQKPWARGEPGRAAMTPGEATARRSPSPRPRRSSSTPATPKPPAATAGRRSGYSTPVAEGSADGSGCSGGFLTPIEVLMHAPAGGGGGGGGGGSNPGATEAERRQVAPAPRGRRKNHVGEEELRRRSTDALSGDAAACHLQQELGWAARPTAVGSSARTAAAAAAAAATEELSTLDEGSGGDSRRRAGLLPSRGAAAATGPGTGKSLPTAGGAEGRPAVPPSNRNRRGSADGNGPTGGGGSYPLEWSLTPVGEAGGEGAGEAVAGGIDPDCLEGLAAGTGTGAEAGAELVRRSHAALLRVVREQEDRGKQARRSCIRQSRFSTSRCCPGQSCRRSSSELIYHPSLSVWCEALKEHVKPSKSSRTRRDAQIPGVFRESRSAVTCSQEAHI